MHRCTHGTKKNEWGSENGGLKMGVWDWESGNGDMEMGIWEWGYGNGGYGNGVLGMR